MAVAASFGNVSTVKLLPGWHCRSQHVPLVGLRHVTRRPLPQSYRQNFLITCTARPRRQVAQLAKRKVCCRLCPLMQSLLYWTGLFPPAPA